MSDGGPAEVQVIEQETAAGPDLAGLQAELATVQRRIEQLQKEARYYQRQADTLAGQQVKADSALSQLNRELKQKEQALKLLSQLGRDVAAQTSIDDVYTHLLYGINATLKMDQSIFFEPLADGSAASATSSGAGDARRYRAARWLGFDDTAAAKLEALVFEVPEGFVEQHGHLLVNKSSEPTPLVEYLRRETGVPYFICVPTVGAKGPFGLLFSGRAKEAKPFYPPLDEGDVSTFQSLSGFLANAIENARLYTNLANMARSFARFVPMQFLRYLDRPSVVEVQLGDQVQKQMTVLFSDIRSFTTLSERMSPRENFNFLNEYLGRVGPLVRQHNGFIDKYIGDAIMALFPEHPGDALAAAVALQQELAAFNVERAARGEPAVAIGVGFHLGSLMLGTIGESERMEGTVISDAVNLASRLEGLTKTYGGGILTSDETFYAIPDWERLRYRYVDTVQVKGRSHGVSIVEVFEADPPELAALKLDTLADFERAVLAYANRDFLAAADQFSAVLRRNPDDRAAGVYHERCVEFAAHGVPADWQGIAEMDHK